jgi:type II secretory pathway component GspD/PulD (secretin)
VNVRVTDNGVSVFAVSADAHEVLTTLGRETQTRVIVDDTVARTITVNLTDRTVEELINAIASAYGLSASQVEGVWMVSEGIPKNPSSYLLSDIDSITTQYVLAQNAKSLLPVFLQDHVKTNQAQNAVILSATSQVLSKFRKDIQQFDVPAQQIMIDVLVVEFTNVTRDECDFASAWANAGRGFTTSASGGKVTFSAATESTGIVSDVLTTTVVLPNDFLLQLHALVEKGKARVRANPRIATVSGQPANVFVGQQQYLSTPVQMPDERWESSIDAGVRLQMTPWTGDGEEIIAQVSPEISTLGAPDPVTGLPDKTTRSASTVVRVRNGETIIIGGLTQDELRETRRRIPLLGHLPLVGRLFRSKQSVQTRTELVIFITPRVLSRTGHLPNAQEEAAIKQRFLGEEEPAPAPPTPETPGASPTPGAPQTPPTPEAPETP